MVTSGQQDSCPSPTPEEVALLLRRASRLVVCFLLGKAVAAQNPVILLVPLVSLGCFGGMFSGGSDFPAPVICKHSRVCHCTVLKAGISCACMEVHTGACLGRVSIVPKS